MNKGTALVTGGSSGIGHALCIRLSCAGYRVISASRRVEYPRETPGVTQISVDFSDHLSTQCFAQGFIDEYGTPDLLVNNAGYGAFYEWKNFSKQEITRQIQVLFLSPVELCRVFAPAMAKQGRGVIVNLSSLATLYPLPYMPLYNASKAALSSFSESLMLEYRKNLTIIDFRMGDVRTEFNNSASKQEDYSKNMRSAWAQINKQLQSSITADQASEQICSTIRKNKSGTFFGGGWFHSRFLPNLFRLLPFSLRKEIIIRWYK